jgi:hypothetical protein
VYSESHFEMGMTVNKTCKKKLKEKKKRFPTIYTEKNFSAIKAIFGWQIFKKSSQTDFVSLWPYVWRTGAKRMEKLQW